LYDLESGKHKLHTKGSRTHSYVDASCRHRSRLMMNIVDISSFKHVMSVGEYTLVILINRK